LYTQTRQINAYSVYVTNKSTPIKWYINRIFLNAWIRNIQINDFNTEYAIN